MYFFGVSPFVTEIVYFSVKRGVSFNGTKYRKPDLKRWTLIKT